MSTIHVLPTHLVNKIAAGEVIERPASIVKELVENALDASATRIEVAVEDGGRKLISISDNGCGMNAEDLALAFTPHATSKIVSDDDLFDIATMGFRGEALASIASVSHAHIRTRQAKDTGGHEIEASGEIIGSVRPCAASVGTTVTIRDLFFNTPARRKFLKTTNTEFGHITEQLTRLSLPYPNVAIQLTHNGREVQKLPAVETTLARAADLFGRDLADVLMPVRSRGRGGAVKVSGLVAPPSAGRATGKWQYFFLNGRYIRDRLLSHALREAFRGRIDPNRWPVAFLFIEVPPADVDVNVHPTKIEVRFRDTQAVHGELYAALKETLNTADLAPDVALDKQEVGQVLEDASKAAEDGPAGQRRESLRQALADFFKSAPKPQPRLDFHQFPADRQPTQDFRRPGPPPAVAREPLAPPAAKAPSQATPSETESSVTAPPSGAIQVHNSYIVAPTEDGLMIIDQHALHERLIYNDLKHRLAEGSLAGQRLLIPETLNVTAAETDLLDKQSELLGRLGIAVEPFGPQALAVQSFPSLLADRGVDAAAFVRELLDKLGEDETADAERLLSDVLDMMACKAAVKAGDPLTPAEIDSLLARRSEAEKASACPHGRPTTLKLTLRDLEKQFKRT